MRWESSIVFILWIQESEAQRHLHVRSVEGKQHPQRGGLCWATAVGDTAAILHVCCCFEANLCALISLTVLFAKNTV